MAETAFLSHKSMYHPIAAKMIAHDFTAAQTKLASIPPNPAPTTPHLPSPPPGLKVHSHVRPPVGRSASQVYDATDVVEDDGDVEVEEGEF